MLDKARGCGLRVDEAALRFPRHQGDPLGTMHESFTGFWKFRRSRRRKIPEGAAIHRSVVTRMSDRASGYAPKLPQSYVVVD